MANMETSLHEHFGNISDPRINRHKRHLLIDVIILTILAVICGAESWDSIELFGKTKIDFLKTILKLPNGIPSHDTINRVFSMLNSRRFEQVFTQWANTLIDKGIKHELIAIDGKTVRRSKDTYHGKSAIHLVNAWANQNQLVLGQYKTDNKSNEITAIPELLELLDIKGSIISIDAMGTQTKIAQQIVDAQADYILALKDNQQELKEEVESIFNVQTPEFSNETVDKGHGRLEIRKCDVVNNLEFAHGKEKWANLTSIVRIKSERTIASKTETETRYYISSMNADAVRFNQYIRSHWGVENSLHWTLDMTFREDEQRKRNGKSAQNFALINKIALNLLRRDKSKGSMKSKRLKAGWDNSFLLSIIKN
ncbi:MAG: ISAs1 family transposase [Bacteroidales bacterium]|nr:ISAs1 family transposase [Bacteroidales bacterium]